MNNLKAIIEALVFVSENPLTIDRIGEILADEKKEKIACIVYDLVREYDERKGGIFLREVAGGYHFRTGEDIASWVMKLKIGKSSVLSRAAMETLAVIAYRQPVMKSEIEKVRGVDVGGILKGLMEKDLVRMMGRKDVPGRPIIYGTTKKFLEVFNLKDLSDLPTLKELEE